MRRIDLSIIVPIFNEEENIATLLKRILSLKKLPKSFEIILVDDGSTDKSLKIIEKHSRANKQVKLLSLTRNFGQQPAIRAGLEHSRGLYAGIIDADLQDPPSELIKMYEIAQKKKVDIVYAVRSERNEDFIKMQAYKLFYFLYSNASESPINMDSGDFSILSRRIVDEINNMPEKIKFIRGLRSWVGYTSLPHPIKRPPRYKGTPKYTWRKLYGLAVNGITSTSTKPLRIATIIGIVLSLASIILAAVYLSLRLFSSLHEDIPGFITIVVLILFFSGLQLFTLGIIGEYIATIFHEVKGRPPYLIKKKVNLN